MPVEESILRAWEECREWIALRDGLTSEIFVLDVPEESIDPLLAAVRERATVVAVLGAAGLESYVDHQWMDHEDDDDLILSTFFIAIHSGLRLQHFLSPSRPRAPGPWAAVSRGPLDLEIAFWPDEVFGAGQGRDAFELLVRYALALREAAGGSTVCVAHGCGEDPRRWLERTGEHPVLALYP